MRKRIWAWSATAAMLILTIPAFAKDVDGSSASGEGERQVLLAKKEAPKKAGKKKPEKEAKADDADAPAGEEAAAPAEDADLKPRLEKWKTMRLEKETAKHARRTARIARMEALATEKGDASLTAKIVALKEKENSRHTATLARIDEKVAKRAARVEKREEKKEEKAEKKADKKAKKAAKKAKKGGT
jgi:hypothetical protein